VVSLVSLMATGDMLRCRKKVERESEAGARTSAVDGGRRGRGDSPMYEETGSLDKQAERC
jgi:hypothetical protein